jgi:predicted ATPase
MEFRVIGRNQYVPDAGCNTGYLKVDNWNDYSFVTMFYLSIYDQLGKYHDLGNVKIGFKGQDTNKATYSTIDTVFTSLPDNYFSLGTDLDYYKKIGNELVPESRDRLLSSLRDVVFDENNLATALEETVFGTSLLRGVSLSTVKGQFKRLLAGGVPLTNFRFSYKRQQEEKFAGIELTFHVEADSKPSTNIHAIIGRNGVGKTTLLNGMIKSVTDSSFEAGCFYNEGVWEQTPIGSDYFSSLVSVSFSAFDPFVPPAEQSNPALGACYYYIGLKDPTEDSGVRLKTLPALQAEFSEGISLCMSQQGKKERWLRAINTLESDENFADMNLAGLAKISGEHLKGTSLALIERMSSGHAIVLITVTKLIATVEEKTLVLIDEPESHLHPPLLSAFTRALSELLHDRNGVAIIATHSPVVLQEVPKSCVWKLIRSRLALSKSRPDVQTFGENVGILTREVFGLELIKSGFHQILEKSVLEGGSFEEIMATYDNQIGFEAQAILRAMILHRDRIAN